MLFLGHLFFVVIGNGKSGAVFMEKEDVVDFKEVEMIVVDKENILFAAEIHAQAWRESHKAFCSEEFVALHTAERQKMYLEKEISKGKRLFMLIDGSYVGIVSICDGIEGSEIGNLYVLPSKQGKGYGRRLLKFAVNECQSQPFLWVLNNNDRAISLYRSFGFKESGEIKILRENLSEIEMVLF